jgi:hypothetical protein
MSPNAWTFATRGWQQVRTHGLRLLWLRYVRRRAILRTLPVPCPDFAELEVQLQVCARDWLNALWTLKSFRHFAGAPFSLLILCDRTVPPEGLSTLQSHFPGARVVPCQDPSDPVRAKFATAHPDLFRLRTDGRYFTLPKIMDTAALHRRDVVLNIDPDVLFFAPPTELLGDLDASRAHFARFNVPRRDADHQGTYSIDAAKLREHFDFDLPVRFNCGLGSLNYAVADWDLVERILRKIPPDPARAFLLVVARHYFGKTRDLMYLEGLPALLRLGLLEKDFRSPASTASSAE